MSTRRCLKTLRTLCSPVVLLAGIFAACTSLFAQTTPATPSPEIMLEPKGVITLSSGDRFAIRVPLHASTAVNLGSAELTISLARDGDHPESEDGVTLIAHLGVDRVLLGKGEQMLTMHGVVPDIPKSQLGAAHAVDYGIRLGSGTSVNIGTPDESFINAKALATSLSGLHFKLEEHPKP